MRLSLFALLLVGCGADEAVPSNVDGTLGGVTLTLGGGGWAWAEPRVPAGGGAEFRPYTFYLELTGVAFDPTAPIDAMELEERHLLARKVALADRLSFALELAAMGEEVQGGGSRFETHQGDGTVTLNIGSQRADDEGNAAGRLGAAAAAEATTCEAAVVAADPRERAELLAVDGAPRADARCHGTGRGVSATLLRALGRPGSGVLGFLCTGFRG